MIAIHSMRNQIFILAISLLLAQGVLAQDKYRAVHWDLQDGLSQAETYHMIKDVNGFLWIGTKGNLSRFDGSTFKNFYYDPKKTGTIDASYTGGGLVEDSLHNIWIGTDIALFRYDIKAETFSKFEADEKSPFRFISPMTATKDTLFCLESDTIITAYNVHTLQKTKLVTLSRSDSIGAGLSTPYSHYDPRTNSIWMLKGYKVEPGGGLLRVFLSTGEKKYYRWPCYYNIKGHSHESEAMCYDRKRNCLWLNSGDGLMQFTLDDNQFHYIAATNKLLNVTKDYFHFVGITLDHQGRIWFATDPIGIMIYDPTDNSVTYPFEKGSALQKEVSHANAKIYIDRDGIIWSGFWLRKGIYQIIPYSPTITRFNAEPSKPDGLHAANVINFSDIGERKFLIGSFQGLHTYDSRTNKFKAFREKDLPGIKGDLIIPMWTDTLKRKALLLNPGNGAFNLNLDTWTVTPFIFKDSANRTIDSNYDRVRAAEHKGGHVMAVIYNNRDRYFILDRDSTVAHEIFTLPVSRFVDFGDLNISILNDFMFVKRHGLGHLTYKYENNKWVRIQTPLDTMNWSRITYNGKDRSFWVVIEKQLVRYDNDFRVVQTFTPKEGLPDVDIFSILPDSSGNIWINTDRSIHQLNTKSGVFSTLSDKDGFQPYGFTNGPSMTMGADGYIYLGGGIFGEGFTRIDPSKYTSTPSSIYVKSLEVNQEHLNLSTGPNNVQELTLKHFQNSVTLETGVIDYYSKGTGHIRYKLSGINEDWQIAPAGYTIRYDGLGPGRYTLQMQASSSANEFTGPIKSLLIVISPPWWTSWWAFALYIIAFGSIVWTFIYYRSLELRRRNVILEEKVAQRTNDLNRSLQDLKQTQNQLIQSEKMASLGELTAGIAHEIQNPLNFVNNFSEVSNELLNEVDSEIEKGNFNEVKILTYDVRKNLEKILHHGKRADGIVKGMLQHSRSSSGIKEPTDINVLADEYLRLAFHGFRAKDKSFNVTTKTDFDKTVGKANVVPQDIGRVILNLITNAFYAVSEKKKQFVGEYEPTVTVKTKNHDGRVLISVIDNGNGIPSKVLDKIFQPFFTTKPTGQGTGLGLSLSYDIVKAHGGELKVETKEGIGSEFTIFLS